MHADWYFDFISPFAYLQWPRVRALPGVRYRPVLLAGLLNHHGQKGPAELPAKRLFTYRHVQWKAERAGIPLRFPPAHPFNPLPALRLCLHAGASAEAIEAIFDHLWRDGLPGDDARSLEPVARRLGIEDVQAALGDPAAKAALQANFDEAIARGVFGVPTLVSGDALYWGEDATAMFEDMRADPGRLARGEMARLADLPIGASRR